MNAGGQAHDVCVIVCSSCPAGRSGLAGKIAHAVNEAGVAAHVTEAECMSGCARPSTVAFRSNGKTAYLFGDLAENDLDDIVRFIRLYVASVDGNFADARPLGALRFKALARIPG